MQKWRLGMRYLAALLLVLLVAGCSQATPTPQPVTIVFATADLDTAYYQALLEEFTQEHPYITIEFSDYEDEDLDVFVGSQFDLGYLLERDAILNLSPFIEQDRSFNLDDFFPGTVDLMSREDQAWAIPAIVNMRVAFYNKDLFDQYGVSYPEIGWTWQDFLDKALALRDPGASVFGYAPIEGFWDAFSFIHQHGGGLFDDFNNPTRATLDNPLNVEAMEWYMALIHEYDVAPTQNQMYEKEFGNTAQSGVYQNKVGIWFGWLSEQGGGETLDAEWPAPWKMRWGMVPLPSDTRAATLSVVGGYYIAAQADHPDACWTWITFLSQQLPYNLAPARKSLAESDGYARLVGNEIAAATRASIENALLLSPRILEFQQSLNAFGQAFATIEQGHVTPQEALTRAQQQAEN